MYHRRPWVFWPIVYHVTGHVIQVPVLTADCSGHKIHKVVRLGQHKHEHQRQQGRQSRGTGFETHQDADIHDDREERRHDHHHEKDHRDSSSACRGWSVPTFRYPRGDCLRDDSNISLYTGIHKAPTPSVYQSFSVWKLNNFDSILTHTGYPESHYTLILPIFLNLKTRRSWLHPGIHKATPSLCQSSSIWNLKGLHP